MRLNGTGYLGLHTGWVAAWRTLAADCLGPHADTPPVTPPVAPPVTPPDSPRPAADDRRVRTWCDHGLRPWTALRVRTAPDCGATAAQPPHSSTDPTTM